MNDNELYFLLVDEIFANLKEKNPKTSDEAFKIIENIRYEIEERLDNVIDEIFDDYCEENNLKWKDED